MVEYERSVGNAWKIENYERVRDMDIVGCKVIHKTLGSTTVVKQTEEYIYVFFDEKERKFQYPDAFEDFLTLEDEVLQGKVTEEIHRRRQEKKAQMEAKISLAKPSTTSQKRERTREKRPNIAFKCNYCDGGKSTFSIGFNGVCSDSVIRYNIHTEHRTWCSSKDSPCSEYLCGKRTRAQLDARVKNGGFVCYESQMLRDWKAMAGIVQHGERKGQPMRLRHVQPNSLCILTTREPGATEAERLIFAVFLIGETYGGDDYDEGFVSAQSKFKLALSPNEARKMRFWRYHVNENRPEKESWSYGLHRYLTDNQAVQILRDIVELKKGTRDEKLSLEFLAMFCKNVGINAEGAGVPNGVLERKNKMKIQ